MARDPCVRVGALRLCIETRCSLWKGKMTSPCFNECGSPAVQRANKKEGLLTAKDRTNPLTPTETIIPSFKLMGDMNKLRIKNNMPEHNDPEILGG